MLTQLSILFLFKRLFTTQKRWFRNTLYALGAASIAQNLAIILTVMFYCVPFNYSWNKSIKGGHCYQFHVVYLIGLLLNLVTDIAILAAPIPIIWGLRLNAKSKKGLTGIFLLGGFVCITNLIRLPYTISIPEGDFTWTNVNAAIWAQAGTCIGIICACLPCYGPLFQDMGLATSAKRPKMSSQSRQSRSKAKAADTYKTLDGQEPSRTGSHGSSKIELVSHDHWKSPTARTKATAQGPDEHGDIETGLSQNVIKVTQDVEVSSTEAR